MLVRTRKARSSAPAALLALALVGTFAGCREESLEPAWMASEALHGTADDLLTRCGDGDDNDRDGLVDCADPDCATAYRCAERGAEPIPGDATRCFDGVDNDEDGFTDCIDWSCLNEGYCRTAEKEEESTVERCTDGLDNDWDDVIDCEDVDCMLLADADICEASDETCADGVDNDKDGYIDCGDYSCNDPEEGIVITVCD